MFGQKFLHSRVNLHIFIFKGINEVRLVRLCGLLSVQCVPGSVVVFRIDFDLLCRYFF